MSARSATRSQIVWLLVHGRLLLESFLRLLVLCRWFLLGFLFRPLPGRLLGRLLPGRQRSCLRSDGHLHWRAVLAEDREYTARKEQPVFELLGAGYDCCRCRRPRRATCVPFHDTCDSAHALDAFGPDRAWLYPIDPLRCAFEETTLVAHDRRPRLEAAVVIDLLGIGPGEGGKVAVVGRKPSADLGGNESGRAFLERARRQSGGGRRLVSWHRHAKMRE